MFRAVRPVLAIFVLIAWSVGACSEGTELPSEKATGKNDDVRLSVYVVNYPLSYFAERIGGPHVRVEFPVPAAVDPAFWKPGIEEVAAYQRADVIFLNGASYAEWVSRASLPTSRIVDTSAEFSDNLIPIAGRAAHTHGAAGEHRHGDVAFTTWLDPLQAIDQAEAIRDALIRLRPEAAEDLKVRFAELESDLRELDAGFAAVLGEASSRPLVFSHPVYQYLIRRYDIDGDAVHWEPEVAPSSEQWREFERLSAQHPVRWMVWEATPDPGTAAALKRRGFASLVFDPCANSPEEGDYLAVMRENLRRLAEAL